MDLERTIKQKRWKLQRPQHNSCRWNTSSCRWEGRRKSFRVEGKIRRGQRSQRKSPGTKQVEMIMTVGKNGTYRQPKNIHSIYRIERLKEWGIVIKSYRGRAWHDHVDIFQVQYFVDNPPPMTNSRYVGVSIEKDFARTWEYVGCEDNPFHNKRKQACMNGWWNMRKKCAGDGI